MNGSPIRCYTRGTDLSGSLEGAGGIGGLLSRSHAFSSGNWRQHNYYHADGNGNVTYLVNSSGGLAASYRYDPFGNLISKSGPLSDANVYRFSSKELHVNSGLYYYLYRFYSPNWQRWMNRDPIQENGGMNLYAMAGNSPLDGIDPLGLRLWYCTTPTTLFDGVGRHGYIWDDNPNTVQHYCGQEGSSAARSQGTPNTGPIRGSSAGDHGDGGWTGTQTDGRDVECVAVDGTENDAANAALMQECDDTIDNNPWLGPGIWDCHTSARRFLHHHGHKPPEFRRWNHQYPKVWRNTPSSERPPVTLPPDYRRN